VTTYSQEVRPYALVALGAVGLTAVAVRLRTDDALPATAGTRAWWSWTAWATLTATAHLLGAVLVAVLAVDLARHGRAAPRGRRLTGALLAGGMALAPQLLWIGLGQFNAGFGSGTAWIERPAALDPLLLLTSTFGAGDLAVRPDGFVWTAPWGLIVVLVAIGTLAALRQARPAAVDGVPAGGVATGPVPVAGDLGVAAYLLSRAALVVVLVFMVAQVVHIWTLRNMIVVVPAVLWGTVLLLTGLAGTPRARAVVASGVLVACALSLAVTAQALQRPYKTDWRSGIGYLLEVRRRSPGTVLVFHRRATLAAHTNGRRPPDRRRRVAAAVRAQRGRAAPVAEVRHAAPDGGAGGGVPVPGDRLAGDRPARRGTAGEAGRGLHAVPGRGARDRLLPGARLSRGCALWGARTQPVRPPCTWPSSPPGSRCSYVVARRPR